jgi:hypothetical protein
LDGKTDTRRYDPAVAHIVVQANLRIHALIQKNVPEASLGFRGSGHILPGCDHQYRRTVRIQVKGVFILPVDKGLGPGSTSSSL